MRKCYNSYDLISSEFGIGFTKKGEAFFFDKEDYQKIKDICWYKDTKTGYIRGHVPNCGGRTSLHRIVMNAVKGETIDHINHKLEDNRKSNLRKCSRSQNSANSVTRKDNNSGYPGVSYSRGKKKWFAQICVNGERINLGYFDTKNGAILARDEASEKYFKEFTYQNSLKQSGRIGE